MGSSVSVSPNIKGHKPKPQNPTRAGSHKTSPLRLSWKSIQSPRLLLYLLGFSCSVIFIVILGTPDKIPKPQEPDSEGIINSNKIISLSEPHAITPFPPAVNPLSELTPLSYGPWTAEFPDSVVVGEPFKLRIDCEHADIKYCPPSYYIQFYGTTAASVPITSFVQLSTRTIEAIMVLNEPGDYQVYAWPNDPSCERWQKEDIAVPVHKQSVQGSPHTLHATYSHTRGLSRLDTHRTCTTYHEILDGRWLNHDLIPSHLVSTYSFGHFHPSPSAIAQYSLPHTPSSHPRYTYSPYPCKIPHRTIVNVIDAIPSLSHILFIGDSVARGYVCARIFPDLFGEDNLGVCEYHPESKVWEHGNKAATWIHPEDPKGRSVDVTLAFTRGEFKDIVNFLDTLVVPQVVVFNMGYWIDGMGDEEFVHQYRLFFDYVDKNWRSAHVLVRSTTSVVQPIQCFEEGGHTRANSYRMRGLVLEAVEGWVERLKEETVNDPFDGLELEDRRTKVSFIDAYTLTDSRPETTMDGYHWMYHSPKLVKSWQSWNLTVRPTVGEADDALLDWMWDEIITGRSLN